MSEYLKQVEEDRRADDEYILIENPVERNFTFRTQTETFYVHFYDVSAFIEVDHEWASFKNRDGDQKFHICNEQEEMFPKWLFEELSHIEQHGKLRPMDEYDEQYTLSEMRGIKGRE